MGWADSYTSRLNDLEECLFCDKPTQSHILLLVYDSEDDRVVTLDPETTVGELNTADAYAVVCHGCHEEHDGDADAAAEAYDEHLEDTLDLAGIEKRKFMAGVGVRV